MRSTAAGFVRDNASGNRVVHGYVTAREGLRYRMEDGTVHSLDRAEAERLGNLGYTPRYVPGKGVGRD